MVTWSLAAACLSFTVGCSLEVALLTNSKEHDVGESGAGSATGQLVAISVTKLPGFGKGGGVSQN